MDTSTKVTDNVALITISGEIDTLDSEGLASELDNLPEDAHSVYFDLEHVSYISSSGLRVLLRAKDAAEERGGIIKVVKTSEFVREILTTVGFHKLFEIE